MFIIYLLLLISISYSTQIYSQLEEYYEYPLNLNFNFQINNTTQYFGNQLLFIIFNDSISIKKNNFTYFNFTGRYLTFEKQNNLKNIILCDNTKIVTNIESNICISYYNTSFGEAILIKYYIFPLLLALLGFLIILYGVGHFLLAIIIHSTIFLFFFLKDLIELLKSFSTFLIPLFLLIGSFISGVLISIYLRDYNNNNLKYKIIKIIYGLILGYFLFKTIFYYIIIFTPLNTIVYTIFLFIFTILGGGLGYAITIIDNFDAYFFISCSTISGSFYIIRGIGYIVGGYYSDIITTKFSLHFERNCKGIIAIYLLLQIFVIIVSVVSQIIYMKFRDNYIDNSKSCGSSKNVSARISLTNNNNNNDAISRLTTANDLSEYTSINNDINANVSTINNSNESINENDNSNNINDQED